MNGFEPLRRRIIDYTSAGQWSEVYDGPLEDCESEKLKVENAKLRELVRDMWRLIIDLDATPYYTERQGNNTAVTWLDEDWSVHESCSGRMRELGIEVSNA